MGFGTIDIVTMTRVQDMSVIKHNEDNKGVVQQAHLAQEARKDSQIKPQEVRRGDDAAWQQKKHDAKEKGSTEYQSDGRRKNKKPQAQGNVMVKGRQGFDIKI